MGRPENRGRPIGLSRRAFLAAVGGAVAAGAVLPGAVAWAIDDTAEGAMASTSMGDDTQGLERGRTRVIGFQDAEMDFQLIRQLGSTRYGGASVGECLALVAGIQSGVPASWVAAFAEAAERQEADAEGRASRGHAVSAADQYLVASNSWRAAEYYSSVADPQHARFGLKSRECFLSAMGLRDPGFEEVWLSLDGTPLPAYHFRAPRTPAGGSGTLMIVSGYDGTLEETYLSYGLPALERGYDLLLFTCPGQMDTLRSHPGLAFDPEVERVARLAVDHLLSRQGTDAQRVALMGISFGGHFATRMAVHEPRISALIANSPIVDLHAYMTSFVGFDPAEMADEDDLHLADLDTLPDTAMPPQVREMTRNLMLRFGRDSFKETYLRLRDFRVGEADLAQIGCPALGLVGEGEGAEPLRQFEVFRGSVRGPVSARIFRAEEGADMHCQTGNLAFSAAVSMDWLDEVLA